MRRQCGHEQQQGEIQPVLVSAGLRRGPARRRQLDFLPGRAEEDRLRAGVRREREAFVVCRVRGAGDAW